ncbi:MAG: hypothetical protein COT34_01350 [Candidatus Nealsonbacteria bacterium CG08_land_8_20_14_0_20_43_11]|uniref:Uncharacterized protein n=1 Tax=Candidatus Nealsonbacteria bacterium CG08_land_8_20_14_0_20_43_11 TaxID=1974706 RepID=A0A2M6T0V0_9BACT|nr:MAG: hypothetical protein COT34_01350 [Candidatus Nealsonbacteria bacterium CG08_land_8_20_14_0_20_43_11]
MRGFLFADFSCGKIKKELFSSSQLTELARLVFVNEEKFFAQKPICFFRDNFWNQLLFVFCFISRL